MKVNTISSREVNIIRFILKNKNGYLKTINGTVTNDVDDAYFFKNKRRARFFAKKFGFNVILKVNVNLIREKKTIGLEIGDPLDDFLNEIDGYTDIKLVMN